MRIIIVDNREVVRLGLRALLDRQPNFTVVDEASTSHEAVQKVLTQPADIVLMDIRMPGGISACREITQKAPHVKVILLTSHVEDERLFEALAAGAAGYVLKQVSSDALVRTIETVGRSDVQVEPSPAPHAFTQPRKTARPGNAAAAAAAFAELTGQELRVLALLAEGKTNRQIADTLFLSEGTVRNYVSGILGKLHVANRVEAAAYAAQHNLKGYTLVEPT